MPERGPVTLLLPTSSQLHPCPQAYIRRRGVGLDATRWACQVCLLAAMLFMVLLIKSRFFAGIVITRALCCDATAQHGPGKCGQARVTLTVSFDRVRLRLAGIGDVQIGIGSVS